MLRNAIAALLIIAGLGLVLGPAFIGLRWWNDPVTIWSACSSDDEMVADNACVAGRYASSFFWPLIEKSPDPELRLWVTVFGWSPRASPSGAILDGVRITPSTIFISKHYIAEVLMWLDEGLRVPTPRAAEIIALLPELRKLDGMYIGCSDYPHRDSMMLEGWEGNRRFVFDVYALSGCSEEYPALVELQRLLDTPPLSRAGAD